MRSVNPLFSSPFQRKAEERLDPLVMLGAIAVIDSIPIAVSLFEDFVSSTNRAIKSLFKGAKFFFKKLREKHSDAVDCTSSGNAFDDTFKL